WRGVWAAARRERAGGRGLFALPPLCAPPLDFPLDGRCHLGAAGRREVWLSQLLKRSAGRPFRVDRQQLAPRQLKTELDHFPADPEVALEHVGRQVSEGLFQDVSARRATRRAARDDGLQAAQALPRIVLGLVTSDERSAHALQQRVGLVEPLTDLAGRRLLHLAAHSELRPELRQLGALRLRPAVDARHRIGRDGHPRHQAYKQQRKQEFGEQHMGSVGRSGLWRQGLTWVSMDDLVPDRIPLEEVYMRMAEELAKRSTCARSQVGSVITTGDLTQVLGIGYNGNARGLPNACDSA